MLLLLLLLLLVVVVVGAALDLGMDVLTVALMTVMTGSCLAGMLSST